MPTLLLKVRLFIESSIFAHEILFFGIIDLSKSMLKNYHSSVADHKEIIRISMSLQGAIIMLKDDIATQGNVSIQPFRISAQRNFRLMRFCDVNKRRVCSNLFLQTYLRYAEVWAEDRVEQVQRFVDSEPITQVIKEKLIEYEDWCADIEDLPQHHIIGPIQIDMGEL